MAAAAAPGPAEIPLEDLSSGLQETPDTDSDSGQGSCETASPGPCSTGRPSLQDGDSEEEIFVRKKAKSKKVLQDSENEDGEDDGFFVQNDALGGDRENGEEKENIIALRTKKSHRIRQGLMDSDDSDTGDQLQIENLETSRKSDLSENELEEERPLKSGKKYRKPKQHEHDFEEERAEKAVGKSKRRKEKEKEKRLECIKQLKKGRNPRAEVDGGEKYPLNDSGCLLDDKELFDNGLEEENDSPPEDEESLESIRAAVKNKIKKYKNKEQFSEGEGYKHIFEDEKEEPVLKEPKRKERKAARLSKEAIKQLHSETQRLIRESSVSLPYHLPEAKSIHEFFKCRPRPVCQGNAMALLKSNKYQPSLTEEPANTKNLSTGCKAGQTEGDQPATNEPETSLGRDVDATVSKPLADVGNNLREDSAEKPRQGSDDSCMVGTAPADTEQQHRSSLSTDCSEQKENEIPLAAGEDAPEQRDKTAPGSECEKSTQQVGPGLVAQAEKVRKSKLEKLRELGIDLSIKPRICSDNESFINLDESDSNKELEALKARFLKHTLRASKSKAERAINMTIIRRETTSEGKEELKADVVPAVLAAESLDETVHTKPGEKLQVLKAKLQEAMKLRRTEERQKRQALHKLDNEEMLEEEEEEEEEEEMTDESEEEEEGNENMEFVLDEAEEDNEDGEEKHIEDGDKETDKESVDGEKLEKSVHCDSVPKPPSTESTLMLFKDSSSKMGYCLHDEKPEMEEAADKGSTKLEDDDSFSLPTLAKENSHNSSFELIGSMIPSYQPCNKQMSRGGNFLSAAGGFRSPSPGFFKTSFISSASKSSGKMSEPSLPIEDSQDLYNASPEPKSLFPGAGESQLQFSLEDDTQSQLLDADGFLNVGQHRNKYQSSKHPLTLASMDENAMDANMDELLDLCSGQFSTQAEHVPSTSSNKKQNMEELLNLCSGKFVSQIAGSPTWASSVSSKAEKDSDIEDPMAEALALCSGSFPTDREEEDEEEQEEFGDFRLVTDDNAFDSEEDKKSGESDAEEAEMSDEEEELLRHRQGLKKKLKLQDFMEDEAELSGSDVGSEDEYDGEDLNEYEEDIIDEELPNEEELENQIQKFHMKAMLDDDKRQLRLCQERYLLDGDLHSDGPGRMRRFRWKNIDYASQMDLFQRDSDNDDESEQFDETEVKWRKERFEREQWLREQKEKNKDQEEEEEEEIGEDSQFMKLAKKVTAKSLQKKASPAVVVQDTALLPRNPFETFRPASDLQIKNGSLLNRPKAVLQKLAAMSDLNPNAPRNSRNFVFHTLSPEKSEEAKEKAKLQVKKRGPTAAVMSLAKRPRGDSPEETSQSRSIFQYLES